MSTQVNPSSATTKSTAMATGVIVVGVDGSVRNRAAIAWAHHEADDLNGRLVLVGATHEYLAPTPRFSGDYSEDVFTDLTRKTLENVRDDLGGSEERIPLVVNKGGASDVLLQATQHADFLVVGKRGLGAVKRMFVGSNSIAVAGRSPIPVVVVPDTWVPATKVSAPVVVGVDGSPQDQTVLSFAFERAERLAVPVMVVHAWQLPPAYSWSPEDITRWAEEPKDRTAATLAPLIERHRGVEVVTSTPHSNAPMAILDAAAVAQLVVLGRHTGPDHVGGFRLGSTARAVLHYSECPVAVIPSARPDTRAELDDPLHIGQPEL